MDGPPEGGSSEQEQPPGIAGPGIVARNDDGIPFAFDASIGRSGFRIGIVAPESPVLFYRPEHAPVPIPQQHDGRKRNNK